MLSALALVAVASCHAPHNDTPVWTDWGENPMQNPAFTEAWMSSAAPTEAHAKLAEDVGDWDVDLVMYMTPDAEGIPAKATATTRMALGGRILIQEYHSKFEAMPMEGLLIMGFDNLKGEYWSIWLDNFSTWPAISEGPLDDEGVVHLAGQMRDVSTPKGRLFRHVSWHEGANTLRAEMYDSLPDGSEFRVMEFTYRRR
jgi:hypothetical protein